MIIKFRQFCFVAAMAYIAISCNHKKNQSNDQNELMEDVTTQPLLAFLEFESKSQLGEGALWNSATQEFYWIDIEDKKLHIYNPKTKNNISFDMPSRIGMVVPKDGQRALVALEDGIYELDLQSGDLKLFSDVENEITTNRFNDGKCDPNGNLWVGSMHLAQSEPNGKLYKITSDGTAHTMLEGVTISNGIVWSKDASTMYYIDTPTGLIKAFDYDILDSSISNERIAVEVPETLGFPDGMAIDENDHLWVGMWNGNCVAQFDPISGELISKVEVPAHNVTSCAFGGENLDILYITTARVDMTDAELEKFPLAGSVFKVRPGVMGVKSPVFR